VSSQSTIPARRLRVSKLSERDRQNVEILCKMHDLIQPYPSDPAMQMTEHLDTLLAYGFKFGHANGCLYGTDNQGRLWQVGNYETGRSGGIRAGRFYRSAWYIIGPDWRRERWRGGSLKRSEFYQFFGPKPKEEADREAI